MTASTEPALAIVIVAAGSGTRLGAGRPKAFVEIGGRSLLVRALAAAAGIGRCGQYVVVAPRDLTDEALSLAAPLMAEAADGSSLTVVAGAETRQGSVAAGLAVLLPSVRTVLVHDAARALTPASLFAEIADETVRRGHGVVPALPVSDTVKRIDGAGSVLETVDRSELAAVQTPQGFPREELAEAYRRADREFTDDAALVAAAGLPVSVVRGDPLAFKVTTPWDRERAEDLLAREGAGRGAEREASAGASPVDGPAGTGTSAGSAPSVGIGTDAHAYDPERPLWLAGLAWPGEPGLAGHSDGDVVAHAITDALLSAAGLGDIGGLFGTDDPRYAGAHGETFLRGARERLEAHGFRIGNVSVQLIANRPRFSARRAEAAGALSRILGSPVSVTATTTDGLGFTGRGDGAAAIASALVYGPPAPGAS